MWWHKKETNPQKKFKAWSVPRLLCGIANFKKSIIHNTTRVSNPLLSVPKLKRGLRSKHFSDNEKLWVAIDKYFSVKKEKYFQKIVKIMYPHRTPLQLLYNKKRFSLFGLDLALVSIIMMASYNHAFTQNKVATIFYQQHSPILQRTLNTSIY